MAWSDRSKKILVASVATVSALVLIGFFLLFLRPKAIARVGTYHISEDEVKARDRLIGASFEGEKRSLGLEQLVRTYVQASLLDRYAIGVTREELMEEASRLDKTGRSEDALADIKNLFGSDQDMYLKVYVYPLLVERKLRDHVFKRQPQIQRMVLDRAEAFLSRVRGSRYRFEVTARSEGLNIRYLRVTRRAGFEYFADRPDLVRTAAERRAARHTYGEFRRQLARQRLLNIDPALQATVDRWFSHIIAKTPVGEVYPSLIAQGDGWLVVRRLAPFPKNLPGALFVVVMFPRVNFAEWLEAESTSVPVEYL